MTPVVAILDGVGGPEVLVIGMLALLMFGSKRLPELGRAFGRAVREFKRATSGVEESIREVLRDPPAKPVVRPAAGQMPARHNPVPPAAATNAQSPAPNGSETTDAPPPAAEPERPQETSLQEPAPEAPDDDPYAPDRTTGESSEPKPSA